MNDKMLKRKNLIFLIVSLVILQLFSNIFPGEKIGEFEENDNWKVHERIQEDYNQTSNVAIDTMVVENDLGVDYAWPMQSHDVRHTGRSPYDTMSNSGIEIWRKRGDGVGSFYGAPLINDNGIIYYGTTIDKSLYAYYPNGTRKWKYKADGSIWATPAIAEDGTIIFPTETGDHWVYALYPDGTVKWKYRDGYETSSISSPAIGSDGIIYFGSDHYPNYYLYAINANGTLRWKYSTSYYANGAPAIGPDGTIYFGSGDEHLYAMNPNGTLKWRFNTGSYVKGASSIAADGTIYVPSFNSYFYALTPNGTLLWKGYTGDDIAAAGLALDHDGTIYVGTEKLRAYHPNGTLKWVADLPGGVYGTVPALSDDGIIYVSAGASLAAYDTHGTMKWSKIISTEQICSSPSIGPSDRIYVGSHDDKYSYLHAFGTDSYPPPVAVSITKPVNGLYLSDTFILPLPIRCIAIGPITIEVQTSQDIDRVEFHLDGTLKATDSEPPYTWTWDTFSFRNHNITVTAYDTVWQTANASIQIRKFF